MAGRSAILFWAMTGVSGLLAQAPPLTLQDALERARKVAQQYQSAVITAELAHEDRVQAKAALLPTVTWFNQYIYTQGNSTPSGVFVANNGVHDVQQPGDGPRRHLRAGQARRLPAGDRGGGGGASQGGDCVAGPGGDGGAGLLRIAGGADGNTRTPEQSLEEARQFVEITRKLESRRRGGAFRCGEGRDTAGAAGARRAGCAGGRGAQPHRIWSAVVYRLHPGVFGGGRSDDGAAAARTGASGGNGRPQQSGHPRGAGHGTAGAVRGGVGAGGLSSGVVVRLFFWDRRQSVRHLEPGSPNATWDRWRKAR